MNSSFRFSLVLLTTAALLRAQSTEASSHDEPLSLDKLVVSAGVGDKTSFDLAQGSSILAGTALRRRVQDTLGDTLDATAGVNSTYYGPGASRPIIRGLGGDRIRVLQSGIGALDASNISPDHNSAVEPLFADRIEVLRGPATLLYGSSAVGGVVNVIDNRIPEHAPDRPLSGAIEVRGFGAAGETAGVAAITAIRDNVALQLNAMSLQSGNVRIPGVARIDAEAPPDQSSGILPNSDIETTSVSLGATWFGKAGHFGAAVSDYETDYGVPVDEPISISMRQHRLDLHGEITEPFGIFHGARVQFGFGDYAHSELSDHTTVNTKFSNKAWEGRLELPHAFSDYVSGTIGAQLSRSNFSAVGDEVVTPPSITESQAVFATEEWKRGAIALQIGGRAEFESIRLGDVPDDLPPVPGYAATSGEKKSFTGASGSMGIVFYPAKGWSTALSLAYSQRMPTAQELFSNGPHGGTHAWEVGQADLGLEKSLGLDLSVRKRAGWITGSISGFVNQFHGYIFERALAADTIPSDVNDEGLTPYQFTAKDAKFYGAEAEITAHLVERESYAVHLQITSDYVRAEQTTDHEPLPRIPPFRIGAGLRFDGGRWHGGVELRHVADQNRIAEMETATPGYDLLNADVSYVLPAGRVTYEFFARGTNLTNEEARVHASFLKAFAPLPGRGVLAGVRAAF